MIERSSRLMWTVSLWSPRFVMPSLPSNICRDRSINVGLILILEADLVSGHICVP
jgi:hypothetical protein